MVFQPPKQFFTTCTCGKIGKSSAELNRQFECPSISGELWQYLPQRYDVTALQMSTLMDADPELRHSSGERSHPQINQRRWRWTRCPGLTVQATIVLWQVQMEGTAVSDVTTRCCCFFFKISNCRPPAFKNVFQFASIINLVQYAEIIIPTVFYNTMASHWLKCVGCVMTESFTF